MSVRALTVDGVDSPSLFPEVAALPREFDVKLTVPRGDTGPLVPEGFACPHEVIAAFAGELAVFSVRVRARDDVSALIIARDLVREVSGWDVPLGRVVSEVRPARMTLTSQDK